mgnify:CR=1 FL=1
MHVFFERTNERKTISFEGTVAQLLSHLHVNPEVVLVSRNKELLTDADALASDDTVQILSVVSGG